MAREYTKKHLVIESGKSVVSIKNRYRDVYDKEDVKIISNIEFKTRITEDKIIVLNSKLDIKSHMKKTIVIEISVESNCDMQENIENDIIEIQNYWEDELRKNKHKNSGRIDEYYDKWVASDIKQ